MRPRALQWVYTDAPLPLEEALQQALAARGLGGVLVRHGPLKIEATLIFNYGGASYWSVHAAVPAADRTWSSEQLLDALYDALVAAVDTWVREHAWTPPRR